MRACVHACVYIHSLYVDTDVYIRGASYSFHVIELAEACAGKRYERRTAAA